MRYHAQLSRHKQMFDEDLFLEMLILLFKFALENRYYIEKIVYLNS